MHRDKYVRVRRDRCTVEPNVNGPEARPFPLEVHLVSRGGGLVLLLLMLLSPFTAPVDPVIGKTTIVPIRVGTNPMGVAFNPMSSKLYVTTAAASTRGNVTIIGTLTNTVEGNITIPQMRSGVQSKLVSVAVNPNTNRIYIADAGQDAIFVVNGPTRQLVSTVLTSGQPVGIVVNPKTNLVYAGTDTAVAVINDLTNQLAATVKLSQDTYALASNQITNRVYVTGNDAVTVIDASASQVVARVPLGDRSFGIALNPGTNMIYVASHSKDNGTVYVIDGSTNSLLTKIHLCCELWGVAVDSNRNMIYVSNDNQSSVSVINGTTNRVIDQIGVGSLPAYISVDEKSGAVYVANWGEDTVSVMGSEVVSTTSSQTAGQTYSYWLLGGLVAATAVLLLLANVKRGGRKKLH